MCCTGVMHAISKYSCVLYISSRYTTILASDQKHDYIWWGEGFSLFYDSIRLVLSVLVWVQTVCESYQLFSED